MDRTQFLDSFWTNQYTTVPFPPSTFPLKSSISTIWFRPYFILILSFWEHWFFFYHAVFSSSCSIVISPFPFPFLLSLTIVEDITRGKYCEDIKMCSLPPFLLTLSHSSSLPSFLLLCCSAQALCCHWGCSFFAESLLCIQPGTMEYSQCVYFFVSEQNVCCFFVLLPSAKEFRRWETEEENERGGVGLPIKPSLSPRGMCSSIFNVASLSVLLSAALALNWIETLEKNHFVNGMVKEK